MIFIGEVLYGSCVCGFACGWLRFVMAGAAAEEGLCCDLFLATAVNVLKAAFGNSAENG